MAERRPDIWWYRRSRSPGIIDSAHACIHACMNECLLYEHGLYLFIRMYIHTTTHSPKLHHFFHSTLTLNTYMHCLPSTYPTWICISTHRKEDLLFSSYQNGMRALFQECVDTWVLHFISQNSHCAQYSWLCTHAPLSPICT